jgi:hypothetical protein
MAHTDRQADSHPGNRETEQTDIHWIYCVLFIAADLLSSIDSIRHNVETRLFIGPSVIYPQPIFRRAGIPTFARYNRIIILEVIFCIRDKT